MESVSQPDKTLLTFAVFTYQQAAFVREAIEGALNQTYSPLEVIISDDCSMDGTYEIAQDIVSHYSGPHKVILRQNEYNLGLAQHINHVMEIAHGELIIVAAGDDVSLPHRTERIYQAYLKSNRTSLSLFSQVIQVDEQGHRLKMIDVPRSISFPDAKSKAEHQVAILGASQAWHRKLFEIFGPLHEKVLSEDSVIPFRASLLGTLSAIPEVLVLYRHHKHNMWMHPSDSTIGEFIQWQRSQQAKRIDNLVGIWTSRLDDIKCFAQLSEERRAQADALQPWIEKKLNTAQLEHHFARATFRKRLWLLLKATKLSVPGKRIMRWYLQYQVPHVYYGVRFLIFNSRLRKSQSDSG
jgi:glycosyltransferase involved in cell wall biosynthesis